MRDAERVFRKTGITFAVYGEEEAAERLIPFDIVPRIISGTEWRRLTQGIEQRVQALNAFLDDIYHRQEILRAGRIPKELIANNEAFLPEMIGVRPPGGVYTHIIGVDIVRIGENEFYVLEDNARTPSGVSYMLENRETMMQLFPELFQQIKVRPVENYPQLLRQSLAACAPPSTARARRRIAVLTPGIYNSAYFEHAFLADQMGVELVEGQDLRVVDGHVAMRTTRGLQADRRALPPRRRRLPRSADLPARIRCSACPASWMSIAPATSRSPTRRAPASPTTRRSIPTCRRSSSSTPAARRCCKNVPTWRCSEADSLTYVLEHIAELVVKEVHGSGGYGMLVGPTATKKEREAFAKKLAARPSQLHRPADAGAVDLPDPDREGPGAAACRSAALSCWSPTTSRSCPAG